MTPCFRLMETLGPPSDPKPIFLFTFFPVYHCLAKILSFESRSLGVAKTWTHKSPTQMGCKFHRFRGTWSLCEPPEMEPPNIKVGPMFLRVRRKLQEVNSTFPMGDVPFLWVVCRAFCTASWTLRCWHCSHCSRPVGIPRPDPPASEEEEWTCVDVLFCFLWF